MKKRRNVEDQIRSYEATREDVERCEGRYPVPKTSPPRDEPFDVTYRCQLPTGHKGQHGPASDAWPDHLTDDVVCEHGRAGDVHCCNCHSGFLFDSSSCVCITEQDPEKARRERVDKFRADFPDNLDLVVLVLRERINELAGACDARGREITLICDMLSSMRAAWKQQSIILNGKAVDFDRGYATGLIQAVTEVSGLLKNVKDAGR